MSLGKGELVGKPEIIRDGAQDGSVGKRRCPQCGSRHTTECYEPATGKYRCACKGCGCEWRDR